jgi:hypothetical protein
MTLKYCDWCEENMDNFKDKTTTKVTLRDENLDDVTFEICSECSRLLSENKHNQLIIRIMGR